MPPERANKARGIFEVAIMPQYRVQSFNLLAARSCSGMCATRVSPSGTSSSQEGNHLRQLVAKLPRRGSSLEAYSSPKDILILQAS